MRPSEDALQWLQDEVNQGGCARRKIGAVLLDRHGNVLARGHNGPLIGPCDCPGRTISAGAGAAQFVECHSIHAEIAALRDCDPKRLYTVLSNKAPCTACVLVLLGTPCQEIYFQTPSIEKQNQQMWEAAGRHWTQL